MPGSSKKPGRDFSIAVPLAVAFLLLAGLWIIYQNERTYRQEQERAAHVQAEILAASVTAALDFNDRLAAQEAVQALGANPQVQMAGIYDGKGLLFAGYHRATASLPTSLSKVATSEGMVAVTTPVTRGGTQIGSIYLGGTIDPLSRRLSRYAMVALLVLMTSLVLGVLGYGQYALRRANRALEQQTVSLAKTNRQLELEIEERGRTEEQLRQAQKMQALGQLTGGIAHDFNNLLTVIQGSADLLRRPELKEDKRLRFANAIMEAATRAALLTGQLLAFARRQPLRPEAVDLNQRIHNMMTMLENTLGAGITISARLDQQLSPIEVDPGQLEVALLNIFVNARDAMPDGGTITICTNNVEKDEAMGGEGRAVAVTIQDTGRGIDPELRDRVFEPFFTTKTVGKGTGLGLSQVYGFTAQSGGTVKLTSEPDKGTAISMLFPASTRLPSVEQHQGNELNTVKGTGRILLVEDNEEVGNFAETLLDELGYAVVRARNGVEAMECAQDDTAFDLVFTDVVMPGMTGLELAAKLKQRHPRLPVVLTTGYSDRIVSAGAEGYPLICKPYRLEALAATLEKALPERQ
ncbi:ATP-binding protein [Rhizorhapis suberifaciens]|uniref:histidine kinase n=1 Tax=Rhizorhapis suberifaciens TaxID=13656 RepID=A0A840HTI5_9SPHN|nr:ATP-binding protein [Rhizorhapis suberifaciens]MBB4640816.1 signal transduction histidine kinase [Rhizorhapis suberifaciens]